MSNDPSKITIHDVAAGTSREVDRIPWFNGIPHGIDIRVHPPTFLNPDGTVTNAHAAPIPAPVQMAPKPIDLRGEAKPAPPVKFSAYVKDNFPKASGLARRAARQAVKSNNRWGRMYLIRKKKENEKN